MSLKAAKEALLKKNYTEAIALLNEYCDGHPDSAAKDYVQAQMWLVSAYQRTGRADRAIPICERFQEGDDPQMQEWAQSSLLNLRLLLGNNPQSQPDHDTADLVRSRPNRYRKANVTLAIAPIHQYLYALSASVTVFLTVAISFGFYLWLVSNLNPTLVITSGWIYVAIALTAITNLGLFFMSPWIIEVTQKQFLKVQWITLADLEARPEFNSAEAIELIEQFCQKHNYDMPQLGWVEDDSPIAYTYGVLPNSARIVVSRGLLEALDSDEIAAVYAFQLAHIANWSASIITYASAPSQLIYGFYVWLNRLSFRVKRGKYAFRVLGNLVNGIYHFANYPLLWTTKTSSYLGDRAAAAATGNPNAIARALTKISRGIVNANPFGQQVSRLLESSRALSICDYKTATPTGIAFEILHGGQSEQNLYRVFLWEICNPWANWTEFHSTHPLVGKRLAGLHNYTKQLGLAAEYEIDQLIKVGASLSKTRLYKNFAIDLFIQTAPYTLAVVGFIASKYLYWLYDNWLTLSLTGIGAGLGIMLQGSVRFPNYNRVASTNLANLLVDPYASSLRGLPVQIPGEIVGYSTNDNAINFGIKLADRSGLIYLDYLPNLRSLWQEPNATVRRLETLVGEPVVATGWFRRNDMTVVDLAEIKPLDPETQTNLKPIPSYHQFWNNLISSALLLSGLALLAGSSLVF